MEKTMENPEAPAVEEYNFAADLGKEFARVTIAYIVGMGAILTTGYAYSKYLERKERKEAQTSEAIEE